MGAVWSYSLFPVLSLYFPSLLFLFFPSLPSFTHSVSFSTHALAPPLSPFHSLPLLTFLRSRPLKGEVE